jgi:hypothetical protein
MTRTFRHWLGSQLSLAPYAGAVSDPPDFADTWADTQPGLFRSEAFVEDLDPAPVLVPFTRGHVCRRMIESAARIGG